MQNLLYPALHQKWENKNRQRENRERRYFFVYGGEYSCGSDEGIMHSFLSDNRVQCLRAQMLEPDNPSSSSSSATYKLCGFGLLVTEPLWALEVVSVPLSRVLVNNLM